MVVFRLAMVMAVQTSLAGKCDLDTATRAATRLVNECHWHYASGSDSLLHAWESSRTSDGNLSLASHPTTHLVPQVLR